MTPAIFPERMVKSIEVIIALIGIFILIQIIRKVLGGSWSTEDLVIGLLLFNFGSLFTIGMMVAQLRSEHKNLRNQFRSLAEDFKEHLKKSNQE